jgi:biofilm PGA synthesis protein PgaA
LSNVPSIKLVEFKQGRHLITSRTSIRTGLRLAVTLVLASFLAWTSPLHAAIGVNFAELGDRAAADIRAASRVDSIQQRNLLVDRALEGLDRILADPNAPPDAVRRSRFDYVLALRAGERMAEVISAHEALLTEGIEPPFYVTEAAADARLQQKDPEQAEVLYRRVLESEPDLINAQLGLFYALLEQENFDQALAVIDAAVDATDQKPESWQWVETRATAAMARAYANQHADAQQRLEQLHAQHPDNARVLRDLATVYRWRGWPHKARQTNEQAAAQAPENIGVQLLQANILSDLGRYAEADELLTQLIDSAPENLHIQRDFEIWSQRRRWSIRAHGEYGESSGGNVSEFGSRDRAFGVRLNAPWLGHYLQPFFLYDYSDARFPEGEADYDRLGAGLSWRYHRQHAYGIVHRNRSGQSDDGLTLGYEWQTGNHWSFAGRYESFSTDVPLRARRQDIDGWKAEFSGRWQAHESLGVRANASRLDISDGNVRWSGLIALPHRLHASAHHRTDASLDLYGSRASQEGGPYFNPSRDASLTYVVEHDWLTWRHYDQSFSQRFVLGAGGYWQSGFGSHPLALGRYEHVWQFSPRWRLHYGIGLASRVYDGDREQRFDGRLIIEGIF